MSALFHVHGGTSPVLDQEENKVFLGFFQVLGIHVAQEFVLLHPFVKGIDEAYKEGFTPYLIEQ